MTATVDSPKSKSKTKNRTGATTAAWPQVNLLPPEVRAARGLRVLKRWLIVVLVLVVALCGVTYAYAKLDEGRASDGLAKAQADTVRLQNEQKKYAEVPRVLGALDATKTALALGTSTEILWSPYYHAIAAVLPAGVSIDTLVVTAATPITAAATPTNPLQGASVGQIAFTARSLALPDTAAWIDALDGVPGFGNAWVSTAAITEDGTTKKTYYTVSASVQVNDKAYAHRFTAAAGATNGKG